MIPTNIQLEDLQVALGLGLLAAAILASYGVFLHGEKFPDATRRRGWKFVVTALAAEALLGFFLLTADAMLHQRQGTLIGTLQVTAAQLQKDAESAKDDAAHAHAEAARLNERAAQAAKAAADTTARNTQQDADAANAAEKLATLQLQLAAAEKDTAQARLDQEKIRSSLAWRTIAPAVRKQIATLLQNTGGSVTLAYVEHDPESISFALAIRQIFDDANVLAHSDKWQIVPEPRVYARSVLFGLFISGPDRAVVDSIRKAFAAAQIPFFTRDTPNLGVEIGTLSQPPVPLTTKALIMVGSKRPLE
jgi:hypothetical protein